MYQAKGQPKQMNASFMRVYLMFKGKKKHARKNIQYTFWKKRKKGYLDAKDGDVGVGHARNAVLKPQTVGLLEDHISLC